MPAEWVAESTGIRSAPRMLNDLHGAELHGGLDRALRRYVRAELLVIDDFAVLAMDPAQAKLAFQVISERYDFRRSTCITTNRPFKDWPKVFPDALNAQVIAERLTERAEHSSSRKATATRTPELNGSLPSPERTWHSGALPSASASTTRALGPRQVARRTVSRSAGGSLGTGDPADSGTLRARR